MAIGVLVNPPPVILSWLSIVGGLIGAIGGTLAILSAWRNRRRLSFTKISATCYYRTWDEWAIEQLVHPQVWLRDPSILNGECRRAFIVVEFSVRNHYPHDVTIGPFRIEDWMFEDKYTPSLYAPRRDYRVFNLHTRQPTTLAQQVRLTPKESYAMRVEVLEKTHEEEGFTQMRSRYKVDVPEYYTIRFPSDVGYQEFKLPFAPAEWFGSDDPYVYHLSDLISSRANYSLGGLIPQGVEKLSGGPLWYRHILTQLEIWHNKLLFGSVHRLHGKPSRLDKLRNHITHRVPPKT